MAFAAAQEIPLDPGVVGYCGSGLVGGGFKPGLDQPPAPAPDSGDGDRDAHDGDPIGDGAQDRSIFVSVGVAGMVGKGGARAEEV